MKINHNCIGICDIGKGFIFIPCKNLKDFFIIIGLINLLEILYFDRTLIQDDPVAGFSIFWADDGLDTGPLLITRQCPVESTDTLDTIYKRFLYPEGVRAMLEAVGLVATGEAPKIVQTTVGATYDPPMFKEENQVVNFQQSARSIFNFIRALDSVPGAKATVQSSDGTREEVRLFGASLYYSQLPEGISLSFVDLETEALVHADGILIKGTDGHYVNVQRIKKGRKVIDASQWFNVSNQVKVEIDLTPADLLIKERLRLIWKSILKTDIQDDTDFFASGAGSMDVVRLIEEAKDTFEVHLENEALFMAPEFLEFFHVMLNQSKNGSSVNEIKVEFKGFTLEANKRIIDVPTQLFINGSFKDAENNKVLDIVNPTTDEVICKVAVASKSDVDHAVQSAHRAFNGPWSKLSARQRGALMFRLADLMNQNKEELATIESVDSGAVFTLALKTHIGMSIDAWRYFAGWTDKIEGATIPTSAARPNNVLTYTKKEPIGYENSFRFFKNKT